MGPETILYTAYPNAKGIYEIPFHICMGLSFAFTMIIMIAISLNGPKVNPKAFELDKQMFKVDAKTLGLIMLTILLIAALYVKFW
jgi:SSS family solute:Na+ symporter